MDNTEEQCRSSIIIALEHIIQDLFPGAQVSLFGSCAGGLSTFLSDLDLTVMFTKKRSYEGDTSIRDTSPAFVEGITGERAAEDGTPLDTQSSWNEHEVMTSYEQEELRIQNAFNLVTLFEALKVYTVHTSTRTTIFMHN